MPRSNQNPKLMRTGMVLKFRDLSRLMKKNVSSMP